MRIQPRPRHYLPGRWLVALKPVLRFSATRDAYVLRWIGGRTGPVFRLDRRDHGRRSYRGVERRRMGAV
ncbi:MAG TPA: hypothetical protein VIJ39_09285 [Solirubrobacteraceae bacterium]